MIHIIKFICFLLAMIAWGVIGWTLAIVSLVMWDFKYYGIAERLYDEIQEAFYPKS